MRWAQRGVVAAFACLLGSVVLVGPAAATADPAAPQQLSATLDGSDPLAPFLELTNAGTGECQVVTTTLGTLALTSVEQGGSQVEPELFDVAFNDSPEWSLQGRLATLAPGETVEIPLRVVPAGPTGQAIELVAWSVSSTSVGWLYPVEPGEPLSLQGRYDVPITPAEGPPACGAADTTADVSAPGSADRNWWWLAAGGLVLAALLFLVVRRRLRSHSAAVGLVLVALTGATLWGAPRATAEINVHDDLADEWAACLANLTMAGGDPANLLPGFTSPGPPNLSIIPSGGDDTHHGHFGDGLHIIFWDPDPPGSYFGSGGDKDGCSSLYHELFHANDAQQGTLTTANCVTADGDSGIPISEVEATRAQNELREKLGLPPRSHYGDKALPTGECIPPDELPSDPQCDGEGCGDSHGDPHLRTFDGQRWSFQAAGEFVAARNPAGGFEIQARQEPLPQSRQVSVNTSVAMDVAGDVVEVARAGSAGAERYELVLTINGERSDLAPAELRSGGTVDLASGIGAGYVVVTWPDGSVVTVKAVGRGGIRYTVQPVDDHSGALEGLLGDFDGDPDNDVRPADGEPVDVHDFDVLYPGVADSWRVDEAASLFTYAPGTGPETYLDREFPDADVDVDELANRAAAEQICRAAGVSDPELLVTCTLDVALTGLPDFAAAAAASQVFVARPVVPPVDDLPVGTELDAALGEMVVLDVSEPGGSALVRFDGEAGQRVFVDVPTSSLPNACGVLELQTADGQSLATGCVIDSVGFVDTVTLPASGTYVVVLDPPRSDLGQAVIHPLPVNDQREPIEPDGSPARAQIDVPGTNAYFTFAGDAGQRVFIDIPATDVPDVCSPLRLIGPDDAVLSTGCLINGAGHIETTELPAAGEYQVAVDLEGRMTGTADVRAYVTSHSVQPVEIGAPARTLAINSPGDTVALTFTGTAGSSVRIEVSDATLPSDCSSLLVLGPDGSTLEDGCIVSGAGEIDAELPVSGEYTVVVDPSDRDTGRFLIRLSQ